MKQKDIQLKKDVAELFNIVEEASKPDHCVLCGKKEAPICYSHIVPQFILKGIAEKGMVCYGQSLFDKTSDFIQTKKGVKNAFTFRLICRDCDKKQFSNYENPDAILNFETLPNDKKNSVLIEMALKTHLAHIYSKVKSLKFREAVYHEELQRIHDLGLPTAFEIDIQEHFQYVRTALNTILERIPKWPSVSSISIDYFTKEYCKIKDFMLENYYKHSKQEDPEPQFICRHRLLHGIITRDVTAADCLKLFLIIRSFAYLERLFIVAEKLIKYNSLTLHTEDRLLFGDEEYEKIIAELLQ